MAEETKIQKKSQAVMEAEPETLVRIFSYDIPGSKNIYLGLTYIKGVSWAISNAICIKLNIPRLKKVSELTKEEIGEIENFLRELPISNFLKNRRFDPETGETKHFYGTDLDMKKEFDIKRLIKIKSYRGIRHATGQPVRGQKTRSHFRSRKNKKTAGIKKVKEKVEKVKEAKGK